MNLTNATSGLDVREARAQYADLASELNRTAREAERLRAISIANTRAEEEAARAAQNHADALDRLRTKYNPLFAASKQYEAALEEISLAEREGAISAQMAALARERAAQTLGAASAAQTAYTQTARTSTAATQNLGYQFNDIAVMLAAGQSPFQLAIQQGTQTAQILQGLGGTAKTAFGALKGAALSMLSPVSLLSIGFIFLSASAVQAGTAIYDNIATAGGAVKDVATAIDELRDATDRAADAASRTTSYRALREEYGRVTAEVRNLVAAQRELELLDAGQALRTLRDSVASDHLSSDPFEVLAGYTNDYRGAIIRLRAELNLSLAEAGDLAKNLRMTQGIEDAARLADHYAKIRQDLVFMAGGYDRLSDAQREVVAQLVDAESASRRFAAAQDGASAATQNASGAASGLTHSIGTAADEAARLLSNLNGVPAALSVMGKSVDAQIASIRAQNKALNLELSEGLSSAAANRRVQLQTMVETATERGQAIHFDTVAAEWKKIEELDAAAKKQAELRDRINAANRPAPRASGGGRARASSGGGAARIAALSEEQRAVEELTNSLQGRLDSLTAERIELQLLSSGQFETADGAKAMAEAMVQGGGAVNAQTASMIKQIDAAAKLNEELRKVAKDPVKEWMDSVPNWIEAGQQIEMGAINHVRDAISTMIQTGTFDIEALGEAILGTVADIVADKAVAELANLMGRGEGDGLGGLFGSLFGSVGDEMTGPTMGGADVAQGGVQAGNTISQAMVQAGQQVAQSISQAMVQGGQQTGQQVRTAHMSGGQQAANATRAAGIQHGQQVRIATMTGGGQHANDVRTAITTAGQQHASMVGAASGGGMGGGMFSGGNLLSMGLGLLPGLFSEGGYSTSAVAHMPVPASAFRNAPHYAQGTANTSGIPAVLHPNEAVIPLSKGRKIPVEMGDAKGGGRTLNYAPTFNIQTPDADSFRKSQKQLAADGFSAAQRAAANNR